MLTDVLGWAAAEVAGWTESTWAWLFCVGVGVAGAIAGLSLGWWAGRDDEGGE